MSQPERQDRKARRPAKEISFPLFMAAKIYRAA
jgi:hypothetical protein